MCKLYWLTCMHSHIEKKTNNKISTRIFALVIMQLWSPNENRNTTWTYQHGSASVHVLQHKRRKVKLRYKCDQNLHGIICFNSLHSKRVNNFMFVLLAISNNIVSFPGTFSLSAYWQINHSLSKAEQSKWGFVF